jgi:hypothetical protein
MVAVRCRGLDNLKREVVESAAEEGLVGCGQPLERQARWSTGLKRGLPASYSYPTYIYHRYHPFIFVGEEQICAWKFLLHLDVCICRRSCMQFVGRLASETTTDDHQLRKGFSDIDVDLEPCDHVG